MALLSAWKQLQQSASIEVSQEVLATSLRMENYIRMQLDRWRDRILLIITERVVDYSAEELVLDAFTTPQVDEAIHEPMMDIKVLKKHFKSAKAFFEGEGKGQLKDVLDQTIGDVISKYVDEHEVRLGSYYEQLFIQQVQHVSRLILEQYRIYGEGFAINDNTVIDMVDIEAKLTRIMH